MNPDKFAVPSRYNISCKSMWTEYEDLATQYDAVNVGVGCSNLPPGDDMKLALMSVAQSDSTHVHEYTRGYGHPRLVRALAVLYSKLLGREMNPFTEFLITCGGWSAVNFSILGFIHPGDEVIVIEPAFDCYAPLILQAGGIVRYACLSPKESKFCNKSSSEDWSLTNDEFESLFNSKTKMLIFNNPHNPTGKVFDYQEIMYISELCIKWDVLCLSDEVYEWNVYSPNRHIRICTMPGMWERTITVGSAGKVFGLAGWKTGWAYSEENLMKRLHTINEINTSSFCTPMQEAFAIIIEKETELLNTSESRLINNSNIFKQKRDFLVKSLIEIGMRPVVPQGGYFILADWSLLENKVDLSTESDVLSDFKLTKWMIKNIKLLTIPPSYFISTPNKPLFENYIRLSYIKTDDTLQQAVSILREWRKTLQ